MCVEKKNTGDLFTASARFVVVVGAEVFSSRFAFVLHSTITRALPSKRKNACGEARLTFNLQIILYYTVNDRKSAATRISAAPVPKII